MKPHRLYILLTVAAAAVFAVAMLAGCHAPFAGAGASAHTTTRGLLSNPSTESSLNLGKILAVLMMVAGAIVAAAGWAKQNWMPGIILLAAGFGLFFTLDLYSTLRPFLFAGAALAAAGSLGWWIVKNRGRLENEFEQGGKAVLPK